MGKYDYDYDYKIIEEYDKSKKIIVPKGGIPDIQAWKETLIASEDPKWAYMLAENMPVANSKALTEAINQYIRSLEDAAKQGDEHAQELLSCMENKKRKK